MTERERFHQQVLDATPGRFEGEPDWTPYFWELSMNGVGQPYYNNDLDDQTIFTEFELKPSDVAIFPELEEYRFARVYITDSGFIISSLSNEEFPG